MTRADTIMRLHQEPAPQPERAQVKSDTVTDSEPDMLLAQERSLPPVRQRFRLSGPEAYQLHAPDIMAMVDAATPPDRAGAFQALAERERLMRMARHLGARGSQGFSPF